MCDQPKISVIMPAYNAEKYIGSMMDSLLAQTMLDFELIVVDDGSRDGTLQLCQAAAGRDRRVVVVSQENSGPSAARNRGLEQARGTYVAFADADDLCEPRWLEKMLDEVNITVNKNTIPFEETSPFITSGIRIGTPSITTRGFKEEDARLVARLITKIIEEKEAAFDFVRGEVKKLCDKYPLYANDIL